MPDDAQIFAFAGFIALVLAAGAWMGDWRRMRRNDPDDVGFMPWTSIFFWMVLAACVLLGLAVRAWLTAG